MRTVGSDVRSRRCGVRAATAVLVMSLPLFGACRAIQSADDLAKAGRQVDDIARAGRALTEVDDIPRVSRADVDEMLDDLRLTLGCLALTGQLPETPEELAETAGGFLAGQYAAEVADAWSYVEALSADELGEAFASAC